MAYQDITFEITQPCMVNLGDGNYQLYNAGEHTVTPLGYVTIENTDTVNKLEQIDFKSNTIKELDIQKCEGLITADSMCKGLNLLEKFNLQGENLITDFTDMLNGCQLRYLPEIYTTNGTKFDGMLKGNSKMYCLNNIDTRNQESTIGMLDDTPNLVNPTLLEKVQITSGLDYNNNDICVPSSTPEIIATPILNSENYAPDDSVIIVDIVNYNSGQEYFAVSNTGDVEILDGKIYWDLPNVTSDAPVILSVYATNFGLVSDTANWNLDILDDDYIFSAEIVLDQAQAPAFNNSVLNNIWTDLGPTV